MAVKRRNNRRRSNRPKHQRLYKVVCTGCGKEVMLGVQHLSTKSFSVSIATGNNEV